METLGIIVNIVLILASVALIAVVLMQQTKSAGLGGAFGLILGMVGSCALVLLVSILASAAVVTS